MRRIFYEITNNSKMESNNMFLFVTLSSFKIVEIADSFYNCEAETG